MAFGRGVRRQPARATRLRSPGTCQDCRRGFRLKRSPSQAAPGPSQAAPAGARENPRAFWPDTDEMYGCLRNVGAAKNSPARLTWENAAACFVGSRNAPQPGQIRTKCVVHFVRIWPQSGVFLPEGAACSKKLGAGASVPSTAGPWQQPFKPARSKQRLQHAKGAACQNGKRRLCHMSTGHPRNTLHLPNSGLLVSQVRSRGSNQGGEVSGKHRRRTYASVSAATFLPAAMPNTIVVSTPVPVPGYQVTMMPPAAWPAAYR